MVRTAYPTLFSRWSPLDNARNFCVKSVGSMSIECYPYPFIMHKIYFISCKTASNFLHFQHRLFHSNKSVNILRTIRLKILLVNFDALFMEKPANFPGYLTLKGILTQHIFTVSYPTGPREPILMILKQRYV